MRRAAALTLLALMAAGCSAAGDRGGAALGTAPTATSAAPTTTAVTTIPPTTTIPPKGNGVLVTGTGVVVPVVSQDGGRWKVTTPCGRTATITGGTFVGSSEVVLDPGHGGSDPGAVSPAGLSESPVNLAVSEQTRRALQAAGISVLLTRSADYDMELTTRAQVAQAVGARAFVSIHHNAEPDGPWPRPGSETYYQIASADSKRLAGLIYEEVLKALSVYQVPWVADLDAGAKYRPGMRGDYYAVLRLPGSIVSALVELAYISNPPEAALIARPDVQQVEGEAVARGIVRYLTTRDPGSGFVEPYPRPTPPPRVGPAPPPPPCTDPAL